jgi:predicted alpha/beta hydrolase
VGVRHQLVWGVPRIGTRLTNLRFAEGENIVQASAVTRDGTKYANNVVGLGAGSGSAQIRVTAANPNTGRLRRTYVYTDQTVPTNARMTVKAQKILTAMQNIDTVTSIVVMNHPNAPWGSFGPGDDIPVMIASGWRRATIWSRITQMQQDPTTDLITLTLARSDSFTYLAESGQAGTL